MKYTDFSLITGAAGLLGKYHAIGLLNLRKNLILTDINLKSCKIVSNSLKKNYPNSKIICLKMDVTNEKSIKNTINELLKKKIIVTTLINNAAIDPKPGNSRYKNFRLENYTKRNWLKELNVGLTGAMLCSKSFGKIMVEKKKKGIILNIASDLSVISPNQSIYEKKNLTKDNQFVKPVTYSVIKHGLIGLTKYISTYWPDKNIRCNSLSPGSILHNQPKILQRKLKNMIPLKRLAKKDEYISAIEFLCSDKSSYMTGHNLIMDGGRSVW